MQQPWNSRPRAFLLTVPLIALVLLFGAWSLEHQAASSDSKASDPQAANAKASGTQSSPSDPRATQSSAGGSQAQQPAPSPAPAQKPSGPTFTSSADLVLVPVIVQDHSGKHVGGLSKEDFTVQENGAEQKISVFEEITSVNAAQDQLRRASIGPGVFSNMLQGKQNVTPRINIIVLDTINTAFADQHYAREQLVRYLGKTVDRHEMTMLLTLGQGGLKVIHDFTTDPAVLLAAVQRVQGTVDMNNGENTDQLLLGADAPGAAAAAAEAGDLEEFLNAGQASMARTVQQFAIQSTLDGFLAIARAFSGVPGRKALIWVTGSFPFLIDSPGDPPSARGFTQDMAHAFQLLNDANISVYPIDARGLVVGMPDASTRVTASNLRTLTQARLNNHASTIDTMSVFATMTGGRAFFNTNDLSAAFQKASDDSSSYYVLGYYRPTGDDKPGWRKLKVKVDKSGLNLRARTGYFVNAKGKTAGEPEGPNKDIKVALNTPMDFTAIPMAMKWEEAKPAPGTKKTIAFQLSIQRSGLMVDENDHNHLMFEVVAVARKANGEPGGQVAQNIDAHPSSENLAKINSGGITYRNQLQLDPGEYSVRFVVRDDLSGRVGSMHAPLKVE